jgi:hypothetical protein
MAAPEVPPCEECGEPGVGTLNEHGMCADPDHIDAVVERVMAPYSKLIEHLRDLGRTRVEPE